MNLRDQARLRQRVLFSAHSDTIAETELLTIDFPLSASASAYLLHQQGSAPAGAPGRALLSLALLPLRPILDNFARFRLILSMHTVPLLFATFVFPDQHATYKLLFRLVRPLIDLSDYRDSSIQFTRESAGGRTLWGRTR